MNRRRWAAAVAAVVIAAAGLGSYLWSARDRCPETVPEELAELDASALDLPQFIVPGSDQPERLPPRIAEHVDALQEAGSLLGEPVAIALLSPRATHGATDLDASFSLADGNVLVDHQLRDTGEVTAPAVTAHAVPEGALRWARRWEHVAAGAGPVGDSLIALHRGGPFTQSAVVAFDPASGALRTCAPLAPDAVGEGLWTPAGAVVVAALPGDDDTPLLAAVDAQAGEVRWQRSLEETTGQVRSLHATVDTVVFSDVATSAALRSLDATGATAGDLQERAAAGGLAVHAVSAADGQQRWSFAAEVPDGARPFAHAVSGIADGVAIVAASRSDDLPDVEPVIHNRLSALDIATGDEVWSVELRITSWQVPAVEVVGDVVVVEDITADDIAVFDLVGRTVATGEELWRLPERSHLTGVAAAGDTLLVGSERGLDIVDRRTGETATVLEDRSVRAVRAEGTMVGVQVLLDGGLTAIALYDAADPVVAVRAPSTWDAHGRPPWG